MKRIWMAVLLLLLMLIVANQSSLAAPLSASTCTITVGSGSVAVGGSVTIPVTANVPSDTLVGALSISLSYDSALLSVTGCTVASGSGSCGFGTPGVVNFNSVDISGMQGALTLANITFQGVSGGTSSLVATVNEFTDPDGNPLDTVTSNGQVTVTGSTVPSRTPTPTRTQTSTTGPSRTPTVTRTPTLSKTPTSTSQAVASSTPTVTKTNIPGAKTATFTPPPTLTGAPTSTKGPTAVPPTVAFYANQNYLQFGECTSLYWQVNGAQAVFLNGGAVNASGVWRVCPAQTTVYTLYVMTVSRDYSYTVTIQVAQPTQVQPTQAEEQGGGAPTPTKKPKKSRTPTMTTESEAESFAILATGEFAKILSVEQGRLLKDEVEIALGMTKCQDVPCEARVVVDRVVKYLRDANQISKVIDALWNAPEVDRFGARWPWAYEMVLEFARLGVNLNFAGVLSPVNIMVTNQRGERVGRLNDNQVYEEIPASIFVIDEESKFVLYPADRRTTVFLQGYADGKMTFFVVNSDTPEGQIILFLNMPVTRNMAAQLDLFQDQLLLKIDTDGDGTVDELRPPTSVKPIRPGSTESLPTDTPTAQAGAQPSRQICGGVFGLVLLPFGGMAWQFIKRRSS